MNPIVSQCPPVLSSPEAKALEDRLFAGSELAEWRAMRRAGELVGSAIEDDFRRLGGLPAAARILVLVGKGHNGGDALIAAETLLIRNPGIAADVVFAFGERALRPLAARAWQELVHRAGDRVRRQSQPVRAGYEVSIDGIFGFQFRPPVLGATHDLIDAVNRLPVRMRVAVDLPSADLFQADFTYATGSVKQQLLGSRVAGRIRYLDLGFFQASIPDRARDRVLTSGVLAPLAALRPANSDKRSFGHVFLIGGSRGFPGAILMATLAAVRSGAGLVTAFVPESLVPAYAARLPEAMWVGWPETPEGTLALEGEHLFRARMDRADAVVIGPGLGRSPETLALGQGIVQACRAPLVLDADALQPEIIGAGDAPRIVTPHAGEYARIAPDTELRTFARKAKVTVVLKGPVTRVCDGDAVLHSFLGGPELARGGSGDLLAGMIGAQLAQAPTDLLAAAARATVWHGLAADALARARGEVAVQTTDVLEHLGPALVDAGKNSLSQKRPPG